MSKEKLIENSKDLRYLIMNTYFVVLQKPREFDFFKQLLIKVCNFCKENEDQDQIVFKKLYELYKSRFKDISSEFSKNKKKRSLKYKCIFNKSLPFANTQIEFYTKRGYNIKAANLKLKNRQSCTSKESFIKRYGSKEGIIRFEEAYKKMVETTKSRDDYDSICKSKASSNYKIYLNTINEKTGTFYTEDEAKLMINSRLSKGLKQSKKFKKRWEDYRSGNNPEQMNTRIEYYLERGMDLKDANIALSKRQSTFSLSKCIEKHGKDNGLHIWNSRQRKWQNTLDSKSEDEKKDILIRKTKKLAYASNISTTFFNTIIGELKDEGYVFNSIFLNNNEYFIYDKNRKKIFFYDFCIKDINYICEFNGHKFHADPRIHETDRNNWRSVFSNKTWYETRMYDDYKINIAKESNFSVDVIWDYEEFESKKNKIKSNIIKLWKEKK